MKSIGMEIVGYRYGEAPECGRSWNYRDNEWECGVSMASVGYDKEIGSFAVSSSNNRRKFYYIGTIVGTGGDDEICLSNVRRISYKEYLSLKKQMKEVSNIVVNDRYDQKLSLLYRGFNVGCTEEEIEEQRNKYLVF